LRVKLIGILSTLLLFCFFVVGCNETVEVTKHTVTFYYGETVLKTVEVEEGKSVENWTPVQEGKDFTGWFATPTMSQKFSFSQTIIKDISIFGGFVTYQNDTREYAIVGSGKGALLLTSNWGNVINTEHKLTKADKTNVNVYKITLDLFADDAFQFVINTSWNNQRGAGYLENTSLNGTDYFSGSTGYGDSDSKKKNIVCKLSGNYTITLTTYPAEDLYDTENKEYTEANKENFNYNNYDKITWVRNGDAEEQNTTTTFYIKGKNITGEVIDPVTGATSWKDKEISQLKMVTTNGIHTLEIFLKKDEEFLFSSRITVGDTTGMGSDYIRYSNIAEDDSETKAILDSTDESNFKAKASGSYTFTYDEESKIITAIFDVEKQLNYDYYIKGTFASGDIPAWQQEYNTLYKLAEIENGSYVYEISNITLIVGDEIIIQSTIAGSTEAGTWGTDNYTRVDSFSFDYLSESDSNNSNGNFEAVSSENNNIKVSTAGNYKITFNAYTNEITFTLLIVD
jgi:hypothetical protein